ncbi:MAG: hypothetical protein NTZ42_04755 [Candidatus Gribaldobacteria bacterium]|nr:hypothetical protein [Candidatus Gribaldobacteria bacterium]
MIWRTHENLKNGLFHEAGELTQANVPRDEEEENGNVKELLIEDAPTPEELQQIEEEIEKGEVAPDFSLLLEEMEKIVDEQIIPEPPKEILEELDIDAEEDIMVTEKIANGREIWLQFSDRSRGRLEATGITDIDQFLELVKSGDEGITKIRDAVSTNKKVGRSFEGMNIVLKKYELPLLPIRKGLHIIRKKERSALLAEQPVELVKPAEIFREVVVDNIPTETINPTDISSAIIEKVSSQILGSLGLKTGLVQQVNRIIVLLGEEKALAWLKSQIDILEILASISEAKNK